MSAKVSDALLTLVLQFLLKLKYAQDNFSAPNKLNFRRSSSQERFAADSQILRHYGLTMKQSYYSLWDSSPLALQD